MGLKPDELAASFEDMAEQLESTEKVEETVAETTEETVEATDDNVKEEPEAEV